jgi:hypothetical protein
MNRKWEGEETHKTWHSVASAAAVMQLRPHGLMEAPLALGPMALEVAPGFDGAGLSISLSISTPESAGAELFTGPRGVFE